MSENGRLKDSELALTYLYYPGTVNGRRLVRGAAQAADALGLAFYLEFGKPLYATDGYRDYATQVLLKKQKGDWASEPGKSIHGWGRALDLASNVQVDGSPEHRWMERNAPRYGWINPLWAENFDPSDGQHEPWHWEWQGYGENTPYIQRPTTGEIGLGSTGAKAERVQLLLNQRLPGPNLVVDGRFGLASAVAVARFQKSVGLNVTGTVGGVTMDYLEGKRPPAKPVIYLKPGTSNAAGTKKLQAFLKAKFVPSLKVDGDYGDATEAAVKIWQVKAGFKPTGTIGAQSRARLVELGVFEPLSKG